MTIKPQDFFGATQNSVLNKPMLHVQDQKAYNVNGQTSVVNSWTSRDLNTVIINQIPGASLVSNSINLPAGTYYVEGSSLISGNSQGISAIFIGGSRVLQGLMVVACLVNNQNALIIPVSGIITISTASVITLKYLTGVSQPLGLGSNYSNGYMNAITDSTTLSIYADLKIWQLDSTIKTPVLGNTNLYPLPGTSFVEGNMFGLEYARTGNNQVTVQPGICMDSLNTTLLNLAAQQVVNLAATVNGLFYLFLCNDGVVRSDTDVNGANLSAYKIRWIGYVPNNSSGIVKLFAFKGGMVNEIWFDRFAENTINTSTAVPANITTPIDLSSFIPVNRISEIFFGAQAVGNVGTVAIGNVSGTASVQLYVNYLMLTAGDKCEWQDQYGANVFITLVSNNIYWGDGTYANPSTSVQLAIHAVKIRR